MKHFKKIFFVLVVAVSLGLVGASDAYAQYACTANSVPTLVRTQGLTEATGSIVLSACTGPAAAAAPVAINITATIQPSAAVITNAGGFAGGTAGFAPSASITTTASGRVQVAGAVSGNTVTFGLVIPAGEGLTSITIGVEPGFAASVAIRVNVFASGVVFPGQIAALLTSSPAGVLAITNNFLNVAIPQPGLSATFTAGAGIAQCAARVITGAVPAVANFAAGPPVVYGTGGAAGAPAAPFASSVATITSIEGFSSAFLLAGVAGEGGDTTAGRATRLLFRLSGVPSNIAIYAPDTVTGTGASAGLTVVRVDGADANGNGGALTVGPAAGTADLIAGTVIVYQVTASSNAVAERIAVPIGLFTTGTPTVATATASDALAAISTTGTAVALSAANPIPRFADVAFSGGFVSVIPCVTNILFPFVTNAANFETGFAISNTTTDIFGTASQTGTCVYNFFGTNAPAGGTFTTAGFGGGTTDTRLLSQIAPGFQGYVITQCNFQLGHGFYFIAFTLGTSTGVAQAGFGLILPTPIPPTTRQGLASIIAPGPGGGFVNFGEGLGK